MGLKKSGIIIFALFFVVCFSVRAKTPDHPTANSKTGYLSAEKPEIKLKPLYKKIFIAPQSELGVLEEAPDYFIFLLERTTGSYYCKILKLSRHTALMSYLDSDRKRMYFRGGIEAETLPISIEKGEELPIREKLRDGWVVLLKRKGFVFPVFVPKEIKGFSFDKLSRFDKYEKKQNAKGLVYHNKKWISKEKFENDRKQKKLRLEDEARRWKNLKLSATKGFIVLKNGKALAGRISGINGKKILFSSSNAEVWVDIDTAADIPLKKSLAKGRVSNSREALKRLDQALRKNKLGKAMAFAEISLSELGKISKDTPEEYNEALALLLQTAQKIKLIYEALEKNSCAIYCGLVFPREELDYHLALNHILFQNKIWLKKDQLCVKCKGEGQISCPDCHGLGKIVKNCEKCKNGLITCHICHGEGSKSCPSCKGLGGFTKPCRNCGGSGYIWELRSPPAVSSPGMTVIRNGKVIVNKPTVIYRPSYPYSRYVQVMCPACHGSGQKDYTCKRCGGKGKVSCPRFEKCPLCRGLGYTSKICEKCNGTKKLECSACNGKGFTGKPREYKKGGQ